MNVPLDFTHVEEKSQTASAVASIIAHLAPARRMVVQAGGCAGLWPLALATWFRQVITFEPHSENFSYLQANIASTPAISAYNAAIGGRQALIGLSRTKPKAGLWRVDGEGKIPMVRLDDVMGDTLVDAIVLDVEGSELGAMQGAVRVIDTHHPLLWFEHKEHKAAIGAFLAEHGYVAPRPGMHLDCYSVHAEAA